MNRFQKIFLLILSGVTLLIIISLASETNAADYEVKRLAETSSYSHPSLDNDWANIVTYENISINYEQSRDQNLVTHALYPYPKRTIRETTTGEPKINEGAPTSSGYIPLILIHGIQSTAGLTDPAKLVEYEQSAEKYWSELLRYFQNTLALNTHFKIYLYKYPSYKHITYNAKILKELIYSIDDLKDQPVVILAHSMGGLVARSLIEEHGFKNVLRLITLATPHHGSPIVMKNWVDGGTVYENLEHFPDWLGLGKGGDFGTPGANDLFWDNYDGVFEWAAPVRVLQTT